MSRAAQFAPFSALTGYDDVVQETARLTNRKVELDEYEKEHINEQLMFLQEHQKEKPEVVVTHFVPDGKKAGGCYAKTAGIVKKIDAFRQELIFSDGTKIPVDAILEISFEKPDMGKENVLKCHPE